MPRGARKGRPRPPGSGRQKGGKNKKTERLDAAVRKGGITPLDYMLKMLHSPGPPDPGTYDPAVRAAYLAAKVKHDELRFEAAKAAAPYLHPRRAPEDSKGRTIPTMIYEHPNLEGPPPEPIKPKAAEEDATIIPHAEEPDAQPEAEKLH